MAARAILVCVTVTVIVALWAVYVVADFLSHDTFECPEPLQCHQNFNQDLPGGGTDPKFSLSPWSIGQRDCWWFSADPRRCALPALRSEAENLCIDLAHWTDKNDTDCIGWTRYVTGNPDALWSPRTDGTNPKCNQAPPDKPQMTANDLLAMKSACCVCGGGLVGRDYAGPYVAPNSVFQPPPPVSVPEQHADKTPTHLTQCCACWPEAVARAVRDQSDARVKEIQDNLARTNNPRGGTLICKKTERVVFDKRRDLLNPLLIGVSSLTALLLCCITCVCVFLRDKSPVEIDKDPSMPLLVRL
jgi:hypothetical protein